MPNAAAVAAPRATTIVPATARPVEIGSLRQGFNRSNTGIAVTFRVQFGDMETSPAAAIRATPVSAFVRVANLPGTPAAARKAASRAAHDGELVPIRKGLYYRGRRTRYGMTRPKVEEIVREVLGGRGVGPAGYSAARAWGVTTQVPSALEVSTLRSVDPVSGVKQVLRRNLARVDLNEKEIALLEVLRAPDVYVEAGWMALVRKVQESLKTGEIRKDALRTALPGERNVAVRINFERLADDLAVPAA